MGMEFELKYRATPEILAAICRDYPGAYTTYHMSTTYYDTPDRLLSGKKWTLRHRMENERHVCTLKMPGPQDARLEYEVERETIHAAIPLLAEESGCGALLALAERIAPVCGARFTRQALTMEQGRAVVELALDQGVLLGGGAELPFAEVEVELKEGSPEEARLLGALLSNKYGLTPEPRSKFARAKALAEEQHGI